MKTQDLHNRSDQLTAEEENYYAIQKKFWTIFAPFYDIVTAPASRVRDKVVSFADAPKGAMVLDVATGTGKQSFAFAKKGYDVTGVDLSEAMLKIARKKNRYNNLKLELANASDLPFKAKTFDVACISFALHEMPLSVREKVLQEMVRVTKPEGRIVIIDFALPENRIIQFLIYHLVKLFEGEHYVKFIKSDLKTTIKQAGIAIDGELRILLGGGRIIRGRIVT